MSIGEFGVNFGRVRVVTDLFSELGFDGIVRFNMASNFSCFAIYMDSML